MNKIYKKSNYILFVIFFLFIINILNQVKSLNVNFVLPLGKSILLPCEDYSYKSINWTSENPQIATVDVDGVVDSLAVGQTQITGTDSEDNKIFVYNIEIVEQEPVKFVHIDQYNNNYILISCVVSSRAEKIKFEIKSEDCTYKLYPKNHNKNNNLWELYTKKINCLDPGDYVLAVHVKIDNKWQTCTNSEVKFKINSEKQTKKSDLSTQGLDFVSRMEGFMSHSYRDIADHLTVGYGELINPGDLFYNNLTKEESLLSLKKKCSEYISAVNVFLTKNKIKFNQNQFDALVSFSYNLGTSWMKNPDFYLRELILKSSNYNIKKYGYVNSKTGLNLRENPDINSKSLKILSYNTKVNILNFDKIDENWYHVELKISKNNKLSGYCYADYLDIKDVYKNKDLNLINKEEFVKEFLSKHHITKKYTCNDKLIIEKKCCAGLLDRRLMELDIFFENIYPKKANHNKYPIPECIKNNTN